MPVDVTIQIVECALRNGLIAALIDLALVENTCLVLSRSNTLHDKGGPTQLGVVVRLE